ncbi:hypothetical protein ACOSQ3_023229 [Xanthoceras sorbifolium]
MVGHVVRECLVTNDSNANCQAHNYKFSSWLRVVSPIKIRSRFTRERTVECEETLEDSHRLYQDKEPTPLTPFKAIAPSVSNSFGEGCSPIKLFRVSCDRENSKMFDDSSPDLLPQTHTLPIVPSVVVSIRNELFANCVGRIENDSKDKSMLGQDLGEPTRMYDPTLKR